jgi:hypothetical protein
MYTQPKNKTTNSLLPRTVMPLPPRDEVVEAVNDLQHARVQPSQRGVGSKPAVLRHRERHCCVVAEFDCSPELVDVVHPAGEVGPPCLRLRLRVSPVNVETQQDGDYLKRRERPQPAQVALVELTRVEAVLAHEPDLAAFCDSFLKTTDPQAAIAAAIAREEASLVQQLWNNALQVEADRRSRWDVEDVEERAASVPAMGARWLRLLP